MAKMIPREEKGRVRHFIAGNHRDCYSPLVKKLQDKCPNLALIASNIPPGKMKKWEYTDKYYHERFKEIRRCLNSLIDYGAFLASRGNDDQVPAIRELIGWIAAYWPDPFEEEDDPVVQEEHYGGLFDTAVSEARSGEALPNLEPVKKENILIGLENYIIDLAGGFDQINQEALDSGLHFCDSVAGDICQTWGELCEIGYTTPAQQIGQTMG